MSRAPWVLPKPDRAFPAGNASCSPPRSAGAWSTRRCTPNGRCLGEGAEILADRYDIGREEQDAFALASHRKAARGWADGASPARSSTARGTLTATSASARHARSRPWPSSGRPSGEAAPSPPATPPRSTTAPPPCSWPARTRLPGSAWSHWPGSWRPAVDGARARSSSGSAPSRRRTGRWPAPAAASPSRRRGAERGVRRTGAGVPGRVAGRSTRTGSIRTAAPSPSATRSARPAAASSGRSPTNCAGRGHGHGVAALCIGVGQGLAVVLER